MAGPKKSIYPRVPAAQSGAGKPKEAIVSRCVAGDDAAWASLYSRYARRPPIFCSGWASRRRRSTTPCRRSFCEAFRSLDKFRGEAAIGTRLCRLAITQARRSREKVSFRQAHPASCSRSSCLPASNGTSNSRRKPSGCCRLASISCTALSAKLRALRAGGAGWGRLAADSRLPGGDRVPGGCHDARKKFQGSSKARPASDGIDEKAPAAAVGSLGPAGDCVREALLSQPEPAVPATLCAAARDAGFDACNGNAGSRLLGLALKRWSACSCLAARRAASQHSRLS